MARPKPDVPRVRYTQRHDGTYDITVSNAAATSLRIHGYPEHIQAAVQQDFHHTLTLDETRKLQAAQDIGEPAYTAVWDDLISARAEDAMRQTHAILPATLENGRDALTSPHYPSYKTPELERR